MFPPTLFRAARGYSSSCRAAMCVTLVALLMPLLSGCDTSGPVEATSDADTHGMAADAGKMYLTHETIHIPDPPDRLDGVGEFVPPEPIGRFKSPRHDKEPAGKWLRCLKKATTWAVAVDYATMAGLAIGMLPEGAQRVFFPRLARKLEDVSHLSDLVTPVPKPTREDVVDLVGEDYAAIHTICFVGFDLPSILDAFPDDAATTFVVSPYWRQNCDVGEVRVEPITPLYNHYHLLFEDPDINCFDLDDGLMGREVDGVCESLDDYTTEPRFLGSMGGDEVIRIRTHDPSTNAPIPFDVPSFANAGDEPVKFRYKTEGGQWFQFNSLGGHTNWGVSVFDAVEVLITNAGTSLDCGIDQEAGVPGGCQVDATPFFVDEFVIGI